MPFFSVFFSLFSWFKCKHFSYITFRLGCFQLYAFCLCSLFSWFKCKHFSYITFRLGCFQLYAFFLFFRVYMQTFQLYNFPARLLSAICLFFFSFFMVYMQTCQLYNFPARLLSAICLFFLSFFLFFHGLNANVSAI